LSPLSYFKAVFRLLLKHFYPSLIIVFNIFIIEIDSKKALAKYIPTILEQVLTLNLYIIRYILTFKKTIVSQSIIG